MKRIYAASIGAVTLAALSVSGVAAAQTSSSSAATGTTAAKSSHVSSSGRVFGTSVSVPPGANRIATVTCPAGKILTGGGGSTSAFKIFFTDSFASGNTWTVRGTNTNTVAESLTAFGVCVGP
jgi:hypothetical protein